MARASATDTNPRSDAACDAARPGPARQRLAAYTPAARADALFVSTLQPSDEPSRSEVRRAAAAAMRCFGVGGCADRMAQEFGDHPEAAVARMRWALAAVAEAFGRPHDKTAACSVAGSRPRRGGAAC
jgi:hypothetical protein